MVSLVDVAPRTEHVKVGGSKVEVFGISALGLAVLLEKFPDFKKLVAGLDVELNAKDIMSLAPQAIASIIAAGTGHPGKSDHEAAAERLPIAEQLELIETTLRLTMPGGVGPFVKRLTALVSQVSQGAQAVASGREPDTKSQRQPRNSLPPVTETPGDTRPGESSQPSS